MRILGSKGKEGEGKLKTGREGRKEKQRGRGKKGER